jgi:hypothetical protein
MQHRDPQLTLSMPDPPRWGGRRVGAGRKPGNNPGLPHVRRDSFRRTHPAHVTLRIRPDLPSLRTVKIVREIERTFARGCQRPGFRLVHYSLQGNHAHLIVEAQDAVALGRGMMAIGARLARAVNRVAAFGPVILTATITFARDRGGAPGVALSSERPSSCARRGNAVRRVDPASGYWFDTKRVSKGEDVAPRTAPPWPGANRVLNTGWRRHGCSIQRTRQDREMIQRLHYLHHRASATPTD